MANKPFFVRFLRGKCFQIEGQMDSTRLFLVKNQIGANQAVTSAGYYILVIHRNTQKQEANKQEIWRSSANFYGQMTQNDTIFRWEEAFYECTCGELLIASDDNSQVALFFQHSNICTSPNRAYPFTFYNHYQLKVISGYLVDFQVLL